MATTAALPERYAAARSRPTLLPSAEGGTTKTCGICGTPQSDAAQSCYRCGAGFAPASADTGSAKKGAGGLSLSRTPREPRSGGRRSTASGGRRESSRRQMLVVVLALVLVAAVGVGLMVKLRGGGSTADAQTTDSGASSALGGAMSSAKDAAVNANTRMIMQGVEAYAAQNDPFPDPGDVTQSGAVGQLAGDQWPTNPYTKAPAKSGTSSGDYTYKLVSGGTGFKLTGHVADGPVCTLP